MRTITHHVCAIVTATAIAATVTLAMSPGASASAPPWEPDTASVGGLHFYDANGLEIIGGPVSSSPIAAYVEGSADVRSGDTRATLFAYTPVSGEAPGAWSGEQLSLSTTYPDASAPGSLASTSLPLVTGVDSDESLATYISDYPNSDTSNDGYAGLYVLRVRTSGLDESTTADYDAEDITVSNGQWSDVDPIPAVQTTQTGLVTVPTGPQNIGTSIELEATVSPAVPGTVQFKNDGTDIGEPVADNGSGLATLTTATLPSGSLSLRAVFTPNADYDYSGSTGDATLAVTPATITQETPTTGNVTAGHAYAGHLVTTDPYATVVYATTSATPGLSVSSSGTITAPASDAPGTYRAAGTDSDADGDSGDWSFSLTVSPITLHQSSTTTGSVTAGTPYSSTVVVPDAFGPTTYSTSSVTRIGTKAALAVSSTGVITETDGADTPTGTYTITGGVSDSHGDSGTWSFTLMVTVPKSLVIASVAPPSGTAAVTYKFTFVAFGGRSAYRWKVSSGSLPRGLRLSTAGVLSGTPTRSSVGRHTVKVKVISGTASATTTITLVIAP